ncbi:histone deacetylase family protein [Halocatena halophila]|uniref:histone deacetylase family protein n=1 Tax=Halocatena halophila TaxID=2814576 RepID=UPI002ED29770
MKFGYREECLAHDTGRRHPESPDRLRAIRRRLSKAHGVEYVAASRAPREHCELVHDSAYVDAVATFCADGGGQWDADTIAVPATWGATLASVGLAEWAIETALSGASGRNTPFSLGRPPGHHAVADDAMGFCFFNNAAIATEIALERVDRVAIIDWDVHHGNGTNDAFYDRKNVFYTSIHEEGLFPGTGAVDAIGTGAGTGTTLNLPLAPGSGDPEYLVAFDRAIRPAIERFDPDLIVVSAGFDAHERDPISRMRVTTEGFGVLTDRVRSLASDVGCPLSFVLEGGYGLESLADSVYMIHDVFDGRQPLEPEPEDLPNELSVVETARELVVER